MTRPHAIVITLAMLSVALPPAAAGAGQQRDGALARGQRVKIQGRIQEDGSFLARRIRLRDPETTSEVEGRILSIGLGGRRLRLPTARISTEAGPVVQRGRQRLTLADLAVGQVVQVKGIWSGRQLHATRIRIMEPQEADTDDEIESEIEDVDWTTGRLVVLGRPVWLARRSRLLDERTHRQPDGTIGRLRRDDDEQQVAPIYLGDRVVLGGQVGGRLVGEENFDLDYHRDRREVADASAQLLVAAEVTERIEAYSKTALARPLPVFDHAGDSHDIDLRVSEAHLLFSRLAGLPVSLQIGRQRFRDAREWFFDQNLDAARMRIEVTSWTFEAAMAQGLFAGPEATRRRRDRPHLIASARKGLGKRSHVSALFIRRDDRDERPAWIGASLNGRPVREVRFWTDAAVRRGRAGEVRLRGWAVDAGGTVRFPVLASPSLTLGYAVGSGDQSTSDGIDSNFRQTRLQDNAARFGGLKRFAYYGELFDPELSNMRILTAAAGVRPASRFSIDLIYHRYDQRELRRSLASNALTVRSDGQSLALGEEIDLVVALQQFRPVDISLVAGVFLPGPAFGPETGRAFVWKPQIRVYF